MVKEIIYVKPKEDVEVIYEEKWYKLNKGEVYKAILKYWDWDEKVPMAYYVTDNTGFDFEVGDCDVDGVIDLFKEYELVENNN